MGSKDELSPPSSPTSHGNRCTAASQPLPHTLLCPVNLSANPLGLCLQIVASCKRIDHLVDSLPDITDDENAQLQRIAALQQSNEDVGVQLHAELAAAQVQLELVQTLYATLADEKLQHPKPRRGQLVRDLKQSLQQANV